MAACRALTAFFISPAAALGSAVVAETTFKRDRARYMGIWTLMITLGIPVGMFSCTFKGPLLMAYRSSCFRICCISCGISLDLLGPSHCQWCSFCLVSVLWS